MASSPLKTTFVFSEQHFPCFVSDNNQFYLLEILQLTFYVLNLRSSWNETVYVYDMHVCIYLFLCLSLFWQSIKGISQLSVHILDEFPFFVLFFVGTHLRIKPPVPSIRTTTTPHSKSASCSPPMLSH